jgi:hypothetical protein
MDKHSSLLRKFVNYEHQKFHKLAPGRNAKIVLTRIIEFSKTFSVKLFLSVGQKKFKQQPTKFLTNFLCNCFKHLM